jgi:DNA polymerase-3 subunit beta
MKFSILREDLIKPLTLVAGVVERRQTLPILANVLIVVRDGQMSLTGTDLEVELVASVGLQGDFTEGEITVPARKLTDICKSLPDGSTVSFDVDNDKVVVRSGRSRFTLSTLSASDFPNVEDSPASYKFSMVQDHLKNLIDSTAFAMAQQDVRYYLNGMLWEIKQNNLRLVATDGHRLAMCNQDITADISGTHQVILPRKGVIELGRLLDGGSNEISLILGNNHLRATTENFTFTSKLIDGKFPDYERVLPRVSDKILTANRKDLREAFVRAAILSNEKYRGVRLLLNTGELKIYANNPDHEEAEEIVSVEYQGNSLEIGFNVSYLLDVLAVINGDTIKFSMSDSNSSATIEDSIDEDKSLYVVMPMRL